MTHRCFNTALRSPCHYFCQNFGNSTRRHNFCNVIRSQESLALRVLCVWEIVRDILEYIFINGILQFNSRLIVPVAMSMCPLKTPARSSCFIFDIKHGEMVRDSGSLYITQRNDCSNFPNVNQRFRQLNYVLCGNLRTVCLYFRVTKN